MEFYYVVSEFLDLRPRYTSLGRHFWSCSTVARQTYPTYELAKVACSSNRQCSFILDEECNDSGPFKLCKAMSFIEKSATDCLYAK